MGVQRKPTSGGSSYEPPIPQSEVTNLTNDLAGKAALSHAHDISNVNGLQAELDNVYKKDENVVINSYNLTVNNGNATFNDRAYFNGQTEFDNTVEVKDSITMESSVTIQNTGSLTVNPTSTFEGNVTVNAGLTVDNQINANGGISVGSGQDILAGNSDLFIEHLELKGETVSGAKLRLQAHPSNHTSTTTLTLPPNVGTSGQVLTTDGTGVLTFEGNYWGKIGSRTTDYNLQGEDTFFDVTDVVVSGLDTGTYEVECVFAFYNTNGTATNRFRLTRSGGTGDLNYGDVSGVNINDRSPAYIEVTPNFAFEYNIVAFKGLCKVGSGTSEIKLQTSQSIPSGIITTIDKAYLGVRKI